MAYRLQRAESISQGVKRVANEQLDKAVADIENEQTDRHEVVHQVRKRFKKLRGLIRLVRPAFEKTYQRENAHFRDAGRELSAVRDAQSLIEGFDRLTAEPQHSSADKPFASLRELLVERRAKIAEEQADVSGGLAALAEDIRKVQQRVAAWELKVHGFDAVAEGFEKTYERAKCDMEGAARKKAQAEDFHEWRKRAKYHWHHCRLLENLWKPMMKVRCGEAKHLAELLGENHDCDLLAQWLAEEKAEFPDRAEATAFREVIEHAQQNLRKRAFLIGRRLFAQKPKHASRQLGAWWITWREAA